MASMRDIKRRIKSVSSTRQITKAMNLVASSKLNRAKSRFNDTKPYFEGTKRVIANVVRGSRGITSPFIQKKNKSGKRLIIVIAGDRGLCGGYNSNVCKAAFELSNDNNTVVITAGSRARDFFVNKNIKIAESYSDLSEKPDYADADIIGSKAVEMYENGEADEVYLVYTRFITTLANEPETVKLLPLEPEDFTEVNNEEAGQTLTIYEPDEESVLNYVIPKYVNTLIYGAMVESAVCELSSRMTAMDTASENATDMIDSLNLVYNRVRQGAITQEITEIVSGSNALE